MLANTIKSEWIKLRSTKSVYWTTVLVIVFSLGISAMIGWGNGFAMQDTIDNDDTEMLSMLGDPFTLGDAMAGVQGFGVMVLIIQAVLIVTGEYGNGTAKLSVLAAPKRWQLPVAKVIVYGGIAAALSLVLAVGSVLLARVMANIQLEDTSLSRGWSLGADGAWITMVMVALYAVLAVAASIGVGYIVRRTAGAMAVMLLWALVLEGVVSILGRVGQWVSPYLPFANMNAAIQRTALEDAPWGPVGSAVYFAVVCVVIFTVGVVVLRRRDA